MKCSHHPDKIFPGFTCVCALLANRDQTDRANDALRKAVALLRSVTVSGMQMAGDSKILRLRKKVGNLHRAQKQLQRAHVETLSLLKAAREGRDVLRAECLKRLDRLDRAAPQVVVEAASPNLLPLEKGSHAVG